MLPENLRQKYTEPESNANKLVLICITWARPHQDSLCLLRAACGYGRTCRLAGIFYDIDIVVLVAKTVIPVIHVNPVPILPTKCIIFIVQSMDETDIPTPKKITIVDFLIRIRSCLKFFQKFFEASFRHLSAVFITQ